MPSIFSPVLKNPKNSLLRVLIELENSAEVIINMASAEPGILVAMATHGYSGPKRWFLGSVAEKVLHGLGLAFTHWYQSLRFS
jgi:nucleotide-binding universal stress UspA family protein